MNLSVQDHLSNCPMDADRVSTNIGQAINAELSVKDDTVRQPRKRFVGRRAATERTSEKANPNSTIEESSAITGIRTHLDICSSR